MLGGGLLLCSPLLSKLGSAAEFVEVELGSGDPGEEQLERPPGDPGEDQLQLQRPSGHFLEGRMILEVIFLVL